MPSERRAEEKRWRMAYCVFLFFFSIPVSFARTRQPSGLSALLPVGHAWKTELHVILVSAAIGAATRLAMILERNAEEKSGRTGQDAVLKRPVTFVRTQRPFGLDSFLLPVGHAWRTELCALLAPPAICAVKSLPMECNAVEERRQVTVNVEGNFRN